MIKRLKYNTVNTTMIKNIFSQSFKSIIIDRNSWWTPFFFLWKSMGSIISGYRPSSKYFETTIGWQNFLKVNYSHNLFHYGMCLCPSKCLNCLFNSACGCTKDAGAGEHKNKTNEASLTFKAPPWASDVVFPSPGKPLGRLKALSLHQPTMFM